VIHEKPVMRAPVMRAFVAGVGLRGPGLDGWPAGSAVLAGVRPWMAAEVTAPPPALLAPNERRRAGLPVRLGLAVAEEAVRMAGLAPDAVRGVFASANGEGAILHDLLETLASGALASDTPQVSPTQFHNSVHNAVAGYWTVAARSRQPMTCLGAHADSFAAGLLKAMAEVAAEQAPVLLCVYDVPLPEPLAGKQPTGCAFAFACALALTPTATAGTLAGLHASWQPEPATPDADTWGADLPEGAALAAMSRQNPAARSLRLLQAIAAGRPAQGTTGATFDRAMFGLLDGALLVQVEPCPIPLPSTPTAFAR
jgi:Beta-ketoacyl synthase, N-terminal domain